MDERAAIAVISGERRDVVACGLRAGCQIASWGYAAAIALRNAGYDRGWLPATKLPVPVISIGNITTGGTGKTPVVAWFVRELLRRGYQPGIVSRGYRSLDGHINDEALVLERLCPGVPHVQDRDRVRGGQRAIDQFGCDVLVLDDAFQHRRIQRDLDVVLIDALQPWGYGHLLPRGLLREPRSALQRADVVLVTRADQLARTELELLSTEIAQHRAGETPLPIQFRQQEWLTIDGRRCPLSTWQTQRVAMFCGIGSPAGFRQSLQPYANVVVERLFPDHHHYTPADLDALERWRQELGVAALVTTLKDAVKIPASHPLADKVFALQIGTVVESGAQVLAKKLDAICPCRDEFRHAA
ncbi:tetraacyldisaccharide 4'-kinase [bacterium]|nr:tetraacyldisaccharide 4'-kinase [bacterium]